MPIGFNLFSFDLFEAFRRHKDEAFDQDDKRNNSPQSTLSDEEEEDRLRKESADKLYWGLAYFPIL
ncbi:hypothetical protein PDO_4898 [Rhizobium sp. PDO1-076]|uniref:hypothetical protein n=1 Tax=Rhizobium sp. PDO1-076 TaxID=1125979 RepID=UPI00024E3937|nr:hypothetical protein [Rhizobium sp. PDO1-076]EHS52067.1 hypothetical protein PDO_4898 [Rhizobium sp. PDO1-076]